MNNPVAIIAATMPLVLNLIEYINKLREVARQTGELTEEEDAALDVRIRDLGTLAHWRKGEIPGPDTAPIASSSTETVN